MAVPNRKNERVMDWHIMGGGGGGGRRWSAVNSRGGGRQSVIDR